MNNKIPHSKAFSLVELSIVVLIIGIIIAGVTQSSSLIRKFKLQSARSLTKSSPVAGIENLLLWYETTLEDSFIKTEAKDGTKISTWYDINPQKILKNNATQTLTANQPQYTENVFNDAIPGVRFLSGGNIFMNLDGSGLVSTSYTIFIVAQRTDVDNPDTAGIFLGGSGGTTNGNIGIGHSVGKIFFGHWGNNLDWNSPTGYREWQNIYTFQLDTSSGKKIWINGGGKIPDASNSQTAALVSNNGNMLGKRNASSQTLVGDLGEVIIYTAALKTEERQEIEKYLSKKYNLALN